MGNLTIPQLPSQTSATDLDLLVIVNSGETTTSKITRQDLLSSSSVVQAYQEQVSTSYGVGITTGAGNAATAGSQNMLQSLAFYDRGNIVYSAITIGVGTITSTSDTTEFGIYTCQTLQDGSGIQPKDQIVYLGSLTSGDLGSTGFKTLTFPTPMSLGNPGVYFLCSVTSNPGNTTPSVRYRNPIASTTISGVIGMLYGFVQERGGQSYPNPFAAGTSVALGQLYGGQTGALLSSYDTGIGNKGSSTSTNLCGFVLNTSI